MEAVTELLKVDFSSVFISVFVILFGVKAITSILEWAINKLGLETKWMREKREEHELLLKTSENLMELQKRHIDDMERSEKHSTEMRNDIKQLKNMFLDTRIDTMRWEINDFASRVTNGSRCNKDNYRHCLSTYAKYEKLLEDNNLENGEVEISIKVVKDSYEQKLKEGF